jgi:surface antigen
MGHWGIRAFALCAALGVALAQSGTVEAAENRGTRAGSVGKATATKANQAPSTRSASQSRSAQKVRNGRSVRSARYRAVQSGGGISCVPYVRMVTGMDISGNGGRWWHNAAGTYDRGERPEPGSVLAFRASGGMSRGHVAMVSRVLGPRHVEVDHANWGGPGIRRGTVMRSVDVIDVSERNDWTSVRVQVGWQPGTFGRTYPTYGFIYNRPDRTMMATLSGGSGRVAAERTRYEEVADAGPQPVTPPRSSASRRR